MCLGGGFMCNDVHFMCLEVVLCALMCLVMCFDVSFMCLYVVCLDVSFMCLDVVA